jgi:hypothetical protein
MKIDKEALVIIGLGAAVYYFMNKKTTTIAVVKNKLIDAVNSIPKSQADCPKDTRFVMGRHGERSCKDFRKTCPKGSEFADVDTFVGEKCRCPVGMVKKPVFMEQFGIQPPEWVYIKEKRILQERQANAPCITEAEAELIREDRNNMPIPS